MSPQRRVVSAWLSFTVLLVGAAAYLGWLSGSVGTEPPATPGPIEVTAPVERVRLVDSAQLACTVTRPTVATLAQSRGRGVISKIADTTAQVPAIGAGQLVAEVDGTPVVVVEGRVPMFRDITVGDRGHDVDSVRATLALLGRVSSKSSGSPWEKGEQQAWRQHLTSLGYPDLDKQVVSKANVLVARSLPAVPAWPDNVLGSTETDRVQLKSRTRSVTCPVAKGVSDITSSTRVSLEGHPDQKLVVEGDAPASTAGAGTPSGDGAPPEGQDASAGDLAGGGDVDAGNRSVTFTAPDLELHEASSVVVSVELRSAKTAHLVVPVTALWTDAQGRSMVRVGGSDPRDVVVTTGFSTGGMTEVTPVDGARLSTQDAVIVGLTQPSDAPTDPSS